MPDNLNFFLTMQFYRSQACDPRAFLSAICTLRVLSCCLFVCLFCCLLFVLAQHISPVQVQPNGLGTGHYLSPGVGGGGVDLGWAKQGEY